MEANAIGQERSVFLAASQQKKQRPAQKLHCRTPWIPPSSESFDADDGA
jgi:hypothetical protein